MAEWVLVFTPRELRSQDLAPLLAARSENRVTLSDDGEVLDLRRGEEHVEIAQDDPASTLGEYEPGELAEVLAALPHPNVFRVSYYRGITLLSETLHAILSISDRTFVDNDRGVIRSLDDVLGNELQEFLAERGGRFLEA